MVKTLRRAGRALATAMGLNDINPADFMDMSYYNGPVNEMLA